jgi:CxxC motif-containing protein (DUF1111 family)
VKGVANYVFDPETGAVRLGRFGWKASKATLRQQAAAALLQDMAVTSPVYRNRSCNSDPASCASAAAAKRHFGSGPAIAVALSGAGGRAGATQPGQRLPERRGADR